MENENLEQVQANQVENADETQTTEVTEQVQQSEPVDTVENAEIPAETDVTSKDAEEQAPTTKQKVKKDKKPKEKKKQDDFSQYEGLSDDEIYAKIQTDKLLRKKKHTRIATLVGLCVAFALAVVIVILAAVPVSLVPSCIKNGYTWVTLYPGNTNATTLDDDDDLYKDFKKVYDKAFSQSYLSAMFDGSLFSYDIDEGLDKPESIIGSGGSLMENNQYFVRLRYTEDQTLTNQNGKSYKSKYRNSTWNGELTFTEAYLEVNETEGFQDTKVYVVTSYPDSEGNETEYVVTITIKANTSAIYKAWEDLTK